MILTENEKIQTSLNRLKGITGFVTTLCRDGDDRAVVFNRYDHVKRVLFVNGLLCRRVGVDSEQAKEVIILHDLNRWPFAQNSERGYFDQAGNVYEYLTGVCSDISEDAIHDVVMLHKKQLYSMRKNARFALLADIIAGLMEDPLLLIAGLNVHPTVIPEEFVDLLGLDFSARGMKTLEELCSLLNREKNIRAFCELFQSVFTKQCENMIDRYFRQCGSVENVIDKLLQDAGHIKEKLMYPIVFPINNELVCHKRWIQEQIVCQLVTEMGGKQASEFLLSIDEAELLKYMMDSNAMSVDELQMAYPDLDYTSSRTSRVQKFISL